MIELSGVSKTVMSGASPLTILHPLDLRVSAGRFLAVTGPSGSGKSTLLGLIAGLDSPSSGRIVIDGTDITSLDEDRLARLRGQKIGFVFQFFHLVPSLTAFENVMVPMEIAGATDAAARASVAAVGGRPHRARPPLPVAALGRRAAAHRHRPRVRERSADSARRRADGQPRFRERAAHHRTVADVNERRGTTLVMATHDAALAGMAHERVALRDGRREQN